MRHFLFLAVLFGLVCLTPSVQGQAKYSAEQVLRLQAGAGFLYLNNDYTPKGDQGVSGWLDATVYGWLGLEAELHLGDIISPSDLGENSYLVGPRISLRGRKSTLYAKAMIGRGQLLKSFGTDVVTTTSYRQYAFGGGVDIPVGKSFVVRAVDAEFQTWPNFKPHGLSPYAISAGVMYILR